MATVNTNDTDNINNTEDTRDTVDTIYTDNIDITVDAGYQGHNKSKHH